MPTSAVDPDPERRPGRALVMGASLAGLLAARVLSEHFQEVWLFERDRLCYGPTPRKGAPQAVHPHGLLARGRDVIEQLLPGFTAALQAQGASCADLGESVTRAVNGRGFERQRAGHLMLGASRLAIEAEIRRRVLALPNVRLRDGVMVLAPMHDHGRVNGLTWQNAELTGTSSEREHVVYTPGDLVIDCTGRGSRSPGWLGEWGYEAPQDDRISLGLQVISAYFARGPSADGGRQASICFATPNQLRPALMMSQEPDESGAARWALSLGGYQADQPAPTPQGLVERARIIGDPDILALVEHGHRLSPVMRHGFSFSQRWRYERLRRLPEGYLVMGDALASFNPIHGQGMTVAACEALALRQALRQPPQAVARAFFTAAARVINTPWALAAAADLALPAVPGPRSMPLRLANAYVARLFRAAVDDSEVAAAFLKVQHLVASPASLFGPRIAWRVWRRGSQDLARAHQGKALSDADSAPEASVTRQHDGLGPVGYLQPVEDRRHLVANGLL